MQRDDLALHARGDNSGLAFQLDGFILPDDGVADLEVESPGVLSLIIADGYLNRFLNAAPARRAAATPTDSKTNTLAFISSPLLYGRPYG